MEEPSTALMLEISKFRLSACLLWCGGAWSTPLRFIQPLTQSPVATTYVQLQVLQQLQQLQHITTAATANTTVASCLHACVLCRALRANRRHDTLLLENYFNDVSCEFDKFRVDTHLCKLRTIYIARTLLLFVFSLAVQGG